MASRDFNVKESVEREVKDLYVRISIGAAGAPTISEDVADAFVSVTKNNDGDYTLVLKDVYAQLKYARAILLDSAAEDIRFQLHSEAVATSKSIRFLTLTDATETDPSDGSVIVLKLEVKNSGEAY